MLRETIEVKVGEIEHLAYGVEKFMDDLFYWANDYGGRLDKPNHELVKEQLAELINEMLELGLITYPELVGRCETRDLGEVFGYLNRLLLTPDSSCILASGDFIKNRVMDTIFPVVTNQVEEGHGEVPDELKDVETDAPVSFQVDDTDVSARLLDRLQTIARAMPSAEYLSKLARYRSTRR